MAKNNWLLDVFIRSGGFEMYLYVVWDYTTHSLSVVVIALVELSSKNVDNYMIPAKMAKMWILSGQLPPWLATRAGHGPDGSTPHQYRWADVVWAPCCHDCVLGCCGFFVVFHWPLVARGSHILHLGLDFCVLAYWGSAALLLSL